MKRFSLLSLASLAFTSLQAQDCSEIFISEYVEGWSNNKAIEIYNPTSEAIDLSQYSLSRWSNGGSTPTTTILEGSIEPNETMVFGLDKRDPNGEGYEAPLWNGWYVYTDTLTGMVDSIYTDESNLMDRVDVFLNPNYDEVNTMYFNGDDALSLEKVTGEIIDIFGKITEDPGEAWSDADGAYWTKDQTLVRKYGVLGGVSDNPEVFDPTAQWDSLPANTFVNLGIHDCQCNEVGLEETKQEIVLIFPNPNNGDVLNLQSSSIIEGVKVQNTLGQIVYNEDFNSDLARQQITLPNQLKGIFFVEVFLRNKESITQKVLLK